MEFTEVVGSGGIEVGSFALGAVFFTDPGGNPCGADEGGMGGDRSGGR